MEIPILNEAKKQYPADMHTTEHILNQTMIRMFDCPRSKNSHIERKKSKCDYIISVAPTEDQIETITRTINEIINNHLAVSEEFILRDEAAELVDLSKLPEDASEMLRIIRVGEYDACACIGKHVSNTSEIGKFQIISHDFEEGKWRVRFKLIYNEP